MASATPATVILAVVFLGGTVALTWAIVAVLYAYFRRRNRGDC